MYCKDCLYYEEVDIHKQFGFCLKVLDNELLPFKVVWREMHCNLNRIKCQDCFYWIEAEGTVYEDNIGGCTYGGMYYPKFLGDNCNLIEKEYKKLLNQLNKHKRKE